MNIYKITRSWSLANWDEVVGYVIVAPSETRALEIANGGDGEDDSDEKEEEENPESKDWSDKDFSSCDLIGCAENDQEEGVIMCDVKHG